MWSDALDLQLSCSSIISFNATSIAHEQYADIYSHTNICHTGKRALAGGSGGAETAEHVR